MTSETEKQENSTEQGGLIDPVVMCDSGHELIIINDSFDHEFGCEQIFYYQCSVCDATHEEDDRIPEHVED